MDFNCFDHVSRQTLREVKQSGSGQVVIDCHYDHIRTVLKQAQAVGMMTHYYDYMLTSLDMHTIDLEDFKYGGTNITSFRLVDPDNPEVVNVVRSWILGEKRFPSRVSDNQIPFIKVNIKIEFICLGLSLMCAVKWQFYLYITKYEFKNFRQRQLLFMTQCTCLLRL